MKSITKAAILFALIAPAHAGVEVKDSPKATKKSDRMMDYIRLKLPLYEDDRHES